MSFDLLIVLKNKKLHTKLILEIQICKKFQGNLIQNVQ